MIFTILDFLIVLIVKFLLIAWCTYRLDYENAVLVVLAAVIYRDDDVDNGYRFKLRTQ